jgi:hypothetical protein
MSLPDVFDPAATEALLQRLDRIAPEKPAQWGKMDAAQMCAHCCVVYEQIKGERGRGIPLIVVPLARLFVKKKVVGEALYGRNIPAPKSMSVADPRDFARERDRLRGYVRAIHGEGAAAFEGRRHPIFGPLTAREWSNLLWKHLDHHFRQFGV